MSKPGRIIEKVNKPKDLNRAIKNWKRKSRFIINELKERKEHQKPSAIKRIKRQKAIYLQKLKNDQNV